MPGAAGVDEPAEGVYGLIVSGSGLVPYVDSSFRVESGMAPVELVVSEGPHSAGKATDDDCAFCDLFGAFNDQEDEEEEMEEEEETDSTSSEGGPDLIVQSPSVSAVTLTPGQAFTLNATVHNRGDEQAAATMLHYYRSNNATITSGDTEVGTDAIGALDASASRAESIALTAPRGVSAEVAIFYGACVVSVLGESNTDNNCSSAVRITMGGQETPEEEMEEEEEADAVEEEELEEEDETPEEEGADGQVTIPDAKLRAAIVAALGKARGATIAKVEMTILLRLEANDAGISDLTGLEFATNLTFLDLSGNDLTDVSALSGLTNLTGLTLHWNDLTAADVSALSDLTNLTWLGLADNQIKSISALSGLTNLTALDLSYNQIKSISALSGLINLEQLYLGKSDPADISALSGLTNLTFLRLENNDLTDISALSGLTNLTFLRLDSNDLTDVSALRRLTNLTGLWLDGNDLMDVSALSSLTKLEDLKLSVNNISDISALSSLTKLEDLKLSVNNISDISALSSLTNLEDLDLQVNPLSASSINDYIPVLERSGATVHFDPLLRESDFDIELVFLDDHFTEQQQRIVRYAARRWMSIIREDLPDYTFTQDWSGTCGDQSYKIPSTHAR